LRRVPLHSTTGKGGDATSHLGVTIVDKPDGGVVRQPRCRPRRGGHRKLRLSWHFVLTTKVRGNERADAVKSKHIDGEWKPPGR
jgi:hypothetical protein